MNGYSINVCEGDRVRAAHMIGDTTGRGVYTVISVETTLVGLLCLEGDNIGSTLQVGAYKGGLHSYYWEKVPVEEQYSLKIQVGDRVRHKSTGQVYEVMCAGSPPVGGVQEVVLEKEGDRSPLYAASKEGVFLDSVWWAHA